MKVHASRIQPRPIKKPKCPTHGQEMYYAADKGSWVCSEEGCAIIARRKEETLKDDNADVINTDGQLSLFIDTLNEETKYILRGYVGGSPFSLDITGNVEMIIDDQSNCVSLCLFFNDIRRK